AGHTVVYRGQAYAMQQLPTGWVNHDTTLVIGPGAYIHPPTLFREIEWINRATNSDIRDRLMIDWRCGVHAEDSAARSAQSRRHHAIGATGKGCAEAIVDKILNRNMGYRLFSQLRPEDMTCDEHKDHLDAVRQCIGDVPATLNHAYDDGEQILIE